MFGKELAKYKVEVVFRKLHKILEKNLLYIFLMFILLSLPFQT